MTTLIDVSGGSAHRSTRVTLRVGFLSGKTIVSKTWPNLFTIFVLVTTGKTCGH